MRNPWGKFEWQGDWSDESDLWTPELREQLDVNEKDDGLFWMCLEDMNKYFGRIQLAKIFDKFHFSSINHTNNYGLYQVKIDTPGLHTFSVS